MKNQYVGDINDYYKYGLIRILTEKPTVPTTVCWMLTPDDRKKTDGKKTKYLLKPNKWRKYDPELFDVLRDTVIMQEQCSVQIIEISGILPACGFFSTYIKSNKQVEREAYFREFDFYLENSVKASRESKLVFFDPDNGIESPKAKPNKKRYIYWDEITEYYSREKTLLIYQHFPRVNHERFVDDVVKKLKMKTSAKKVYSFETKQVVFFLVPFGDHDKKFEFARKADEIANVWKKKIRSNIH
ncbi:hypothetical protein ACFLRW_04485 [Acidobacteriota bacterium]